MWNTWQRRTSLADAVYKIACLAEERVDLDLLLNAELRGPGKNLTRGGVAATVDFIQKIAERLSS